MEARIYCFRLHLRRSPQPTRTSAFSAWRCRRVTVSGPWLCYLGVPGGLMVSSRKPSLQTSKLRCSPVSGLFFVRERPTTNLPAANQRSVVPAGLAASASGFWLLPKSSPRKHCPSLSCKSANHPAYRAGLFGFHSRSNFFASASCSRVILDATTLRLLAASSRSSLAECGNREAARSTHMYA